MSPIRRLSKGLAVTVVASFAAASACAGGGLSISLTQDQLQRIVDGMFPQTGERERVGVTLSNPSVTLANGSDQVAFGLAISVSVELEPGEGRVAAAVDERVEQRAAEADARAAEGGRGARARQKVQQRVQDRAGEAREGARQQTEERVENRDPELLSGTVAVSSAVRYDAETGELFLTDFRIEELLVDQLPGRFTDPVTSLASGLISSGLDRRAIYQIDDSSLGGSIARALLNDVVVEDGVLKITVGPG